jgi:transposase
MDLPLLAVDVSCLTLDLVLRRVEGDVSARFANDRAGFVAIARWLQEQRVREPLVCLEWTGTYGAAFATYAHKRGWRVAMISPAMARHFARCLNARTKNDPYDAFLLAELAEAMELRLWTPPSQQELLLRQLTRLRRELVEERAAHRTRLHTPGMLRATRAAIERLIKALDKEIATLEHQIEEVILGDPVLAHNYRLLLSIPSLGPVVVPELLAEIGEIGRFDNARQLAAFFGLTPAENRSGTSVRGRPRLCKIGNARVRHALFLAAMTAMRYNPVLHEFAERLRARGKAPKAVIGAVMRKLAHLIFGVLHGQRPFDPDWNPHLGGRPEGGLGGVGEPA